MRDVTCILCGNNETDIVARCRDLYTYVDKKIFTLVRCRHCGLVYLNPQPSSEELMRYYPPNYSPYLTEYSVFSSNRFYNALRRIKRLFFPLQHPPFLIVNRQAEEYTFRYVFGIGRTWWQRFKWFLKWHFPRSYRFMKKLFGRHTPNL